MGMKYDRPVFRVGRHTEQMIGHEVPFYADLEEPEVLIEAEWPDLLTLGVVRYSDGEIRFARYDPQRRRWRTDLKDWQQERIEAYWALRRDEVLTTEG